MLLLLLLLLLLFLSLLGPSFIDRFLFPFFPFFPPFDFSFPSCFRFSVLCVIMLSAVKKGEAKKLAELIRQDSGFKVNMAVDAYGN